VTIIFKWLTHQRNVSVRLQFDISTNEDFSLRTR
jgi:hypothetical protein